MFYLTEDSAAATFFFGRSLVLLAWSLLLQSMTAPVLLLSSCTLGIELALVKKALFYGPSHRSEAVFNANIAFGGRLKVWYAVVLGKFLTFFPAYFPFIDEVTLVSNQYLTHIIVSKFINFEHPLSHILESFPISHVIDNNDSMRASIVARCQRPKSLLSCGIPNLKFNVLSIHFNSLDFEIDSDRIKEIIIERKKTIR